MHISKRDTISRGKAWTIRAIAILLALIVDGIIIYAIVKMNPLKVYVSLASGAFGTSKRMWFTIRDCMILTCIAIGLAPAFKMRFWNVGAEGQMLVGGIATAFWMINFAGKMNIVMLFLCMAISAIVAGGIWGLIPGFFKAKWNTNETLFTLMMNYIAIQLTSFAVSKWENPPGSNSIGTINSKGDVKYVGWIGNMFSDGYNKDFMWTVVVVLVLAALVYLYLKYTKHGYETAVSHTLSTSTAGGRGFTAIIVAWLAKMNPFVMILISALLSFLDKGAVQIASDFGLNEYVSQIISGVILFFILGSEFFINYQVKSGAKHK